METEELVQKINKLEKLLSNQSFIKNAPEEIILKEKNKLNLLHSELNFGKSRTSINGSVLYTEKEVREKLLQVIRANNN